MVLHDIKTTNSPVSLCLASFIYTSLFPDPTGESSEDSRVEEYKPRGEEEPQEGMSEMSVILGVGNVVTPLHPAHLLNLGTQFLNTEEKVGYNS